MITWRLRKGADRRIRSGHPWIFSNELQESPKGIEPGSQIRLTDAGGSFLAYGYGNPNSLIAFRATSFQESDSDQLNTQTLVDRLLSAWWVRKKLGFEHSFRLVYSEADGLPGLVVDRYLLEGNKQVFSVQILTKGMDIWISDPLLVFKMLTEKATAQGLTEVGWNQSSLVLRNDVNIRKLEAMEVEPTRVLHGNLSSLESVDILLRSLDNQSIHMNVDLIHGQKTGFFLDQSYNIQLVGSLLKNHLGKKQIRILDLCCYMGHWSAQLARLLLSEGASVEVTLLDVSELALQKAQLNLQRLGARVITEKKDVLDDLGALQKNHYDVVIADPPAFIKSKKDVPTGKHAYLKLNTNAFQLVSSGGLLVSCSCSGLLLESEFHEILNKASRRAAKRVRCLLMGGNAPDHPSMLGFPEGRSLKMVTHQVQ